MDAPTVFIVDDDPSARRSVSALIESLGVRAEAYGSAEEFLSSVDPDRPGCLVTDYRMLGMTGLDLQNELNSQGVTMPVIIITAYADVPLAVQAMQGGAVTLLEKPCRDQQLSASIRQALQLDAENRATAHRVAEIQGRLETLTDGERQVLQFLIEGKMNKVIAKHLDIAIRTVELRRHEIMKKMQTKSLAELVRTVMEVRDSR